MKRLLFFMFSLLFIFGFIDIGQADDKVTKFNSIKIERTAEDDYLGSDVVRIDDASGNSIYRIDSSFNLSILDSSGTTDTYLPRDRVIYITSIDQLSSWAGQSATAGISYYQLSPGKVHLFDLESIARDLGTATSAFGNGSVFSGVSAIAPDASIYNGPAYDFAVGIICDDANYLSNALTGATMVTVWPYPGSGATSYDLNATTDPQSIHTMYGANGTIGNHSVGSGVSYFELNIPSEITIFGLEDGGVSVFPRIRNVFN